MTSCLHVSPTEGRLLAAQALSDMQAAGGAPNSRVMFTFLQACWGAALSRQQVARVFAEAAAMRAVRRPDESVYAALLIFAERQGVPEQGLDVWHALREVPTCCSPLFGASSRAFVVSSRIHPSGMQGARSWHAISGVESSHGYRMCEAWTAVQTTEIGLQYCVMGHRTNVLCMLCRTMCRRTSTCSRRCSPRRPRAARRTCWTWRRRRGPRCSRPGRGAGARHRPSPSGGSLLCSCLCAPKLPLLQVHACSWPPQQCTCMHTPGSLCMPLETLMQALYSKAAAAVLLSCCGW